MSLVKYLGEEKNFFPLWELVCSSIWHCAAMTSSKKALGKCFFVLASSAVSSITSSVTEEQSAGITVVVIKTFHIYYCSSVGNFMTKCEKKE